MVLNAFVDLRIAFVYREVVLVAFAIDMLIFGMEAECLHIGHEIFAYELNALYDF